MDRKKKMCLAVIIMTLTVIAATIILIAYETAPTIGQLMEKWWLTNQSKMIYGQGEDSGPGHRQDLKPGMVEIGWYNNIGSQFLDSIVPISKIEFVDPQWGGQCVDFVFKESFLAKKAWPVREVEHKIQFNPNDYIESDNLEKIIITMSKSNLGHNHVIIKK